MKLTLFPDKKIREKSLPVSLPLSKEDEAIVQKMIAYIENSQKPGSKLRQGIGIAAVQLGYLKRMFHIHVEYDAEGNVFNDVIINPVLIAESNTYAALERGEGCLSVKEDEPEQEGLVHRKNRVVIKGYSYVEKREKQWDVSGFLAIVFQHEYDHLDGKLFIDRIRKNDKFKQLDNEILI